MFPPFCIGWQLWRLQEGKVEFLADTTGVVSDNDHRDDYHCDHDHHDNNCRDNNHCAAVSILDGLRAPMQSDLGPVYTETFSTENANFYGYTFHLHENANENAWKRFHFENTIQSGNFWKRNKRNAV